MPRGEDCAPTSGFAMKIPGGPGHPYIGPLVEIWDDRGPTEERPQESWGGPCPYIGAPRKFWEGPPPTSERRENSGTTVALRRSALKILGGPCPYIGAQRESLGGAFSCNRPAIPSGAALVCSKGAARCVISCKAGRHPVERKAGRHPRKAGRHPHVHRVSRLRRPSARRRRRAHTASASNLADARPSGRAGLLDRKDRGDDHLVEAPRAFGIRVAATATEAVEQRASSSPRREDRLPRSPAATSLPARRRASRFPHRKAGGASATAATSTGTDRGRRLAMPCRIKMRLWWCSASSTRAER